MEKIVHKTVAVNGINLHVAELGQGPIILFIHGFPELWYSWRHQILHLASHGYRAVAPDLRGYGDTTGVPTNDHTKFTTHHVIGDLIALVEAIKDNNDKIFVVGHNWGAILAWQLCLYRPNKVKAMVNMNVPFVPRHPTDSIMKIYRKYYGDDHYIARFQVPGEIEAEFANIGTRTTMRNFLTNREPSPLYFPKGKGFAHMKNDTKVPLPSWLSEEDVDYFANKFEQTGFTGGLNYYRAFDLSWELNAPWGSGTKVEVPSKFIVGDLDFVYHKRGVKEYIHNGEFHKNVPLLEDVVVMEGVGHFINQEKPDEINAHILDLFNKF